MQIHRERLLSIIKSIRSMAPFPPQTTQWEDLRKLTVDFTGIYNRSRPFEAELPILVSEIAGLNYEIALSSYAFPLIGQSMKCLIGLGPIGWALVVRYLEKGTASFDKLAGLIRPWAVHEQLLLINQLFKMPRAARAEYVNWAVESLGVIAASDSGPIFEFLQILDRYGEQPVIQIREALSFGPFGQTLEENFFSAPRGKRLDNLLSAALRIGYVPLVDRLLELRSKYEPADEAKIIKVVSQLAGAKDSRTIQVVGKSVLSEVESVWMAALDALVSLRFSSLDSAMILLMGKRPEWENTVLSRLVNLDENAYNRLLGKLDEGRRKACQFQIFSLLTQITPEVVVAVLEKHIIPRMRSKPQFCQPCLEMADFLKDFIRKNKEDLSRNYKFDKSDDRFYLELHGVSATPGRDGRPAKQGGKDDRKSQEFVGKNLSDKDVKDNDLTGAAIKDMAFESSSFTRVDFSHSTVTNSAFRKCKFVSCRFVLADVGKSLFEDCVFRDCEFSFAKFKACSLSGCDFFSCVFTASFCLGVNMTFCAFDESFFQGASYLKSLFNGCRWSACALPAVGFIETGLRGCEVIECFAPRLTIRNSSFKHCALKATYIPESAIHGLDTDEPYLSLENRRQINESFASQYAQGKWESVVLPESAYSQAGSAIAGEIVKYWFRVFDFRKREMCFLMNNRRRTDMTLEKMGGPRNDVFILVPLLLGCDIFDRRVAGKNLGPNCRIVGYHPAYRAWESLKRRFQNISVSEIAPFFAGDDGTSMPSGSRIPIEALYTIGSLGGAAQTSSSDLDYWICALYAGFDPQDMDKLRARLKMMEEWAMKTFGPQVTFFLMDTEDIRADNYGKSDEESSGSAQARALKEEFYRSAVLVAGKEPAWWVTPPEYGQTEYNAILEFAMKHPIEGVSRMTDLGYPAEIPLEEFFGASLWQMVKAFKSPFKSILKFGLLDKYISDKRADTLLCNRIKRNLLDNLVDEVHIDPYIVMYREVSDFYRSIQDSSTFGLVKLAFMMKAETDPDTYEKDMSRILKTDLLDYCLFPWNPTARRTAEVTAGKWDYVKSTTLGKMVNQFMLRTYAKVRETLSQSGSGALIDSKDLTRLGRKIFAMFAQRENKIERVPFMGPGKASFVELLFMAERLGGRVKRWLVKGLPDLTSKSSELVQIGGDKDITRLLAWVVANDLYAPSCVVKGDSTLSPISAIDLGKLLPAIRDFFPVKETFSVDLNETDKEETILKAFFVLNLLTPRDVKQVKEVAIIYTTNWGEMFCKRIAVTDTLILANPLEYLRKSVTLATKPMLPMAFYTPNRSACPKPKYAD